ncbi:MAG: DNA alkylation repair protein [Bacteroidales bacterium]|nr:DNA alkylation repair protein [Bacteroidales bacterium]MDD6593732.1 DNA alkylation repair protein [Bacteroidales bacterium]
MNELQQNLFGMRDAAYAAFIAKLTPGFPPSHFIGVRVPLLRTIARSFAKEEAASQRFLSHLPHSYYEEDMLHGMLISLVKDYDRCLDLTDRFLPYVDNWAVCDTLSPKVFAKHKAQLLENILRWSSSSHTYTCRFGLRMLMTHFLDDSFSADFLEIPAAIRSEEYYVKMMVAWFFATALAKQWEATLPYLENRQLDPWTHRKTIQKAIESYRIPPERKDYLRTLRK